MTYREWLDRYSKGWERDIHEYWAESNPENETMWGYPDDNDKDLGPLGPEKYEHGEVGTNESEKPPSNPDYGYMGFIDKVDGVKEYIPFLGGCYPAKEKQTIGNMTFTVEMGKAMEAAKEASKRIRDNLNESQYTYFDYKTYSDFKEIDWQALLDADSKLIEAAEKLKEEQKEKQMTTKVTWKSEPKALYFTELDENQSFRIATTSAHGAVYRKVAFRNSDSVYSKPGMKTPSTYYQLEEATGRLFNPTSSPVELVPVEISISSPKPDIYK